MPMCICATWTWRLPLFHESHHAGITLVTQRMAGNDDDLESVEVDQTGLVSRSIFYIGRGTVEVS